MRFLFMLTAVITSMCLLLTQSLQSQVLDKLYQQSFGCQCVKDLGDTFCYCKGRKIKEFPDNLPNNVSKLTLMATGIEILKNDSLKYIATFFEDLHIEDAVELREIEADTFQGCTRLRTLHITRAPKLKKITNGVFSAVLPHFRMLRIAHSGLEMVPNMNLLNTDPTIMSMIDFDSNSIRNITSSSIKVKAENLILDHNDIEVIEDWSFHDSQIANLSLKGNRKLWLINEDAFTGLKNLRSLDLSETSIIQLPTHGLESLEVLKMKDVFQMWKFPSVLHFPEIKEAYLTYPYHCCAFRFPVQHDSSEFARLQSLRRDVHKRYCTVPTPLTTHLPSAARKRRTREDDVVYGEVIFTPPPPMNFSESWEKDLAELFQQEGCFHPVTGSTTHHFHHLSDQDDLEIEGIFHPSPVTIRPKDTIRAVCGHFARDYRHVKCFPEPDAFNPCEDVMGGWWLRATVWAVLVAALLGNMTVLIVLLTARSAMTVSKFLMCHLAFADLCMGAYLLNIAVVDARTIGIYFNHAIEWQHGTGCKVAGFLTVFSSELSIYTLTVITLERWYAITYAIHLNRRLHLGTAAKVMFAGWLYAVLMAALPLCGINSYARTSICLPMENRHFADVAYLVCLLSAKGFAFVLICTCYAKMYFSIRVSSSTGNRDTPDLHANRAVRSDLSVAKRMAMLVFTDFACWAPIAFFGLTAVAGHPLIDVTESKILLVFFFPLNSCANPFLYAILTKQYHRDVIAFLARWGMCRRRGSRVTLSTHTQQRHVSALYRNRQQVVIPANTRRVHGVAESDSIVNEFYVHAQPSPVQYSVSFSKESSPSVHRGSPHRIKNSSTKLQNFDQQLILRRIQDYPPSNSGSHSTSQVTTAEHTTDTTTDATDDDPRDTAV